MAAEGEKRIVEAIAEAMRAIKLVEGMVMALDKTTESRIVELQILLKSMVEDIKSLNHVLRRDNGGASLIYQVHDLKRQVSEILAAKKSNNAVHIEGMRGRWALMVSVVAALISAVAAIVVAVVK